MTDDNKTFVDLVLERMDTNPEEFIEGGSKLRWDALIQSLRTAGIGPQNATLSIPTYNSNLLWALTEDEVKALAEQYKKVYREFLRREFLKNIMDEPNALHRGNSIGYYEKVQRVNTITAQTLQATIDRECGKVVGGNVTTGSSST